MKKIILLLFLFSSPAWAQTGSQIGPGPLPGISQTGPTTWTPSDQSGASLTFTGVSVNYTKLGNMVLCYGEFTYPATVSSSAAVIGGLPVTVSNGGVYAYVPGQIITNAAIPIAFQTVQNTTTATIVNQTTRVGILNSALTGATIDFILIYPAL